MQRTPLAFYEGRYAITDQGDVINLANNKPLVPVQNPNGYWKVSLADGQGGHKQFSLHRLVALHFLPNPYGHPQVNHKDGDKSCNKKDNLQWVTAAENIDHAYATGLRPGYVSANDKEMYLREVLQGRQVAQLAIELNRRPETLHKMLRETAKRLGIHDQWNAVMRENRRRAAIRNLEKINP